MLIVLFRLRWFFRYVDSVLHSLMFDGLDFERSNKTPLALMGLLSLCLIFICVDIAFEYYAI
jgi:hypothetical protein